uniref:Uncharacterized protein n=1 Tax=Nigrospora oryzae unassigned RNA virus 1 TaxID=1762895 RepID=A0A0U2URY9_9VIRU|nr:hypothetical protein [Nigrospora oryzae unassigned RNA virus 1]
MSTTNAIDSELVAAFNSHFKLKATPQAVGRLLGSPHVRPWYAEYRAAKASSSALPDQWKDAGMTAEEWASVMPAKTHRTEARAASQKRLSELAERYKRDVEVVNTETMLALRQHESPMVLVVEGGYEQLSLAAQARIEEMTDPDARAGQLKAELAAARKTWLERARSGANPFRV